MPVAPKQRTLSEMSIVRAVAEQACRRCVNSIRRSLERRPAELSGEGSGLSSVWDEICVQVQYEESFQWDAYEQTMLAFVEAIVEDLAQFEREAIWLQTEAAFEWEVEEAQERDPYPVYAGDIVDFIMQEHLLAEAGRWNNPRIRAFINRVTMRD
jgi:hypothetical protein